MNDSSFLQVTIDFSLSHLLFPYIIQWVMAVLAILIAIVHGPDVVRSLQGRVAAQMPSRDGFDTRRLFGTLALLVLYFLSMDRVGQLFPNTGMGFLLTSIPFMFALSLLYVHDLDRRKLALIAANAVVSPLVAWFVLARLFFITLP
ncbi:tripartite tricarboxylate transporter TctB family protein [Tropicimonas sp.]|uniref:tripartite tricarboxylate transporter TctB family protein n=1 Tax=Tropicimonas sp. TaxID=2067044 RepID=UPI003A8C2D54